ncbi:MAG: 1-deoxy-D-xylulose-5-phosphate reductoisomerase [Anaerovoracaceae bacterium]
MLEYEKNIEGNNRSCCCVSVLGATGSIGTQALELIRSNPEEFKVIALSCGRNIELFKEQIIEFRPEMVSVQQEEDALDLARQFPWLEVAFGLEGLIEAAIFGDCRKLLNGLVGMIGLAPTYAAIEKGIDIALANKETLVAGGSFIMNAVKEKGVSLLPVDSEHSAIFQCIQGNEGQGIKRIILTASGGPFRGFTKEQLSTVTVEQALKHPNWRMGSKITIDSATMMNKGLEVIEAYWLFDISADKIEPIVHPESIIHSMIEFEDHSILAQLGQPDMRVPINYALTYPDRRANNFPPVDFLKLGALHFEAVDRKLFKCLDLAYEALEMGGAAPAVLNTANEVLVSQFLEGRISFTDIPIMIERVLEKHTPGGNLGLEDILQLDREIREILKTW